jgi:hypothetical protein
VIVQVLTVRQCVRERKQELGGRMAFVPQSYDWGQEAQVDWFEAVAKLEGEPRKLQFFGSSAPHRKCGVVLGPLWRKSLLVQALYRSSQAFGVCIAYGKWDNDPRFSEVPFVVP